MNPKYNIYRQLAGDALTWVDRADGLQQAKEHVVRLGGVAPGNYIIFDVRERTVVWAGNTQQQFGLRTDFAEERTVQMSR
jgi:hypothetical protein